ncbi:hypothetical protein [Streptomyces sp. NPDC002490]|uniref:hypothetical protein n=1 Tax=Streptomyces sp. NPDC002490 TaxID=3154416 RepID=UPI003316E0E8
MTRTRSLRAFVALGVVATALTGCSAADTSSDTPVTEDTEELFARSAEAVIERRTGALLDPPAPADGSRGPVRLSPGLLAEEKVLFGKLARSGGEPAPDVEDAYAAARSTVAVDRVTVAGDTATARMVEETALTRRPPPGGGEAVTTEFLAEHRFVFRLGRDRSWTLVAAEPLGGPPVPDNQLPRD